MLNMSVGQLPWPYRAALQAAVAGCLEGPQIRPENQCPSAGEAAAL